MVSGGCVGAEGEVDPEAVAPAAATEEAVVPVQAPAREVVVGYALTTKKAKSFLQPKLRGLARKKGILFVAIDQKRPLSDQGPFDIVLHKLTGKGWQQLLEEYREAHPEVTVLDPPGAIANLLDRQSMLQEVSELDLTDCHGKVRVPKQLFVNTDPSSIPAAVRRAGLSLPLVAKPLVAKSHELSLAYDPTSLTKLEPPLVLQEFVNHGGVMFKVYIVGDAIRVVRRFSLPNVDEGDLLNNAGVFRFPRVSCAAASADDADLDPGVAELPPRPLLEILARELRRRLGLRLFNIDMIRQHGTRDRFYVIDMNYFPVGEKNTAGEKRNSLESKEWLEPGTTKLSQLSLFSWYGKMPGYEHVFTDFLLSLGQKEYKRRPSYGSLSSGEG
ncbi:hypothetical protein SORBI_3001G106900 [Sorghum bicolor]|uniref:Inositol-tetrakisphosphate 1-kinase n=2 Tax=Sorghum bicolor TaxID=4558 RepID=A0A1Z5S566_SORBI|nr:hypothetical protein SORBI_3001G106900 [Sorghum bicolor]